MYKTFPFLNILSTHIYMLISNQLAKLFYMSDFIANIKHLDALELLC